MSALNNERNPSQIRIPLGALAAGATSTLVAGYFRKRSRIKTVTIVDLVALGASGTVYVTGTLQDQSATPKVYATGNSQAGVAAGTPLNLALQAGGGSAFGPASTTGLDADSASQPEVDVPAGTVLSMKVVSTSTATLSAAAVAVIEYYSL